MRLQPLIEVTTCGPAGWQTCETVTSVVSVLSAAVYVPSYAWVIGAVRLLAAPLPMLAAQILVQGVLSGVVAVIAFSKAAQIIGAGRAAVFPALVQPSPS